ncbi:Cytochrome b-c1 complex, subunit 10 [Metarhizium album ARSEF 1941]|uniref:Cytochrome b-c1 complex, subunit 10 n=1 Tax=Metarhizium album (strain ARSEF 1941) TaxID=1081103 RepID=A0A0B2WSD5_METAS|nr:Cytochrome b-c1 complex, subunit 10 [Metarhizium album ARSEF 1941]KHN98986.1 Cytochrome b-c1 complex, subunit 10 [Metarhizium album ARSEF 1941]
MAYPTPIRAAEFKSAYGPKYVPSVSKDLNFDRRTEMPAETSRAAWRRARFAQRSSYWHERLPFDLGAHARRKINFEWNTEALLTLPQSMGGLAEHETNNRDSSVRSASFGGAAAVGLLLYVSGIPRVQRDILQKIPFLGRYFTQPEIHPQDNPF